MKRHLILMIGMLTLAGCETSAKRPPSADLLAGSNRAAFKLASPPGDVSFASKPVTIVTTFVDGEDFSRSSAFGRTISEQVAGDLVRYGFPVKEIRLRGNIIYKGNLGELVLSRELKDIAREYQAEMVVVGTYTEAANKVFVSIKMIRVADNRVVTASNLDLPKDDDMVALLHGLLQDRGQGKQARASLGAENSSPGHTRLFDAIRQYDEQQYGTP